jgi:hypothetical protein
MTNFKTHILYVALWFKFTDDLFLALVLFKSICYLHFWISCKALPTKAYTQTKYFHDITFSLQTYILMSWIRIDFCGTRLRSWPFLVHALWVSTLEISQTSLGIHPKPKTSFCDYLLDHNLTWVWMIFQQIFWRFSGKISRHITYGGTRQRSCKFRHGGLPLKISKDL